MPRPYLSPLLIFVCLGLSPLHAQDLTAPNVTVRGEASVKVEPDIAEVRAGITNQAKSAREASEANSRAMAGIVSTLREQGIDAGDIQTSRFSIHPLLGRQEGRGEQRVSGYQVSNIVTVRVRNISGVSETLDRLVAAGANTISGIDFQVTDPSRQLDVARAAALEDARRKAEVYAKAAGVQLGRIIAITETGASVPSMALNRAALSTTPPISPGEETLRVSISASFEILR